MNQKNDQKVVSERSRNRLRKEAFMLREKCGFSSEKKFPITSFLELVLPEIDPLFQLEIVDDEELRGRSAEMIPERHTIVVKESVYDAACGDNFYARRVLAHELGHYVLHSDDEVRFASVAPGERLPETCNPEWQADVFAEELLVPVNLINEPNEYLVSKHFGVSRQTAKKQIYQAQKLGRARQKKIEKRKKRKVAELHTQPQIS